MALLDTPDEQPIQQALRRIRLSEAGRQAASTHHDVHRVWETYLNGASLAELMHIYQYPTPDAVYKALMLRGYTQLRPEGRVTKRKIHYMYDTDSWCTDKLVIEVARTFLGDIDIDPATNLYAQEFIRAKHFYTKETNGLTKPWYGRLWLNPPYSMPLIKQFTDKLIQQVDAGNVTEGMILVNSASDTQWCQALMMRYPVAFSRRRLQFTHPDYVGTQNRVGQALFYVGGTPARAIEWYRAFDRYFYPPLASMKLVAK